MLRGRLRIRLTPAVWVTLAPFLLFLIPLVTGKALFWGLPYLQFIPWRHYAWLQLRLGILPLWNPLNGMGAPLLANYQLALFYPPALPLFLLDELFGPAGLAWGFTLLVPLHLAWGGLGMVRLMQQLGTRQRGQIVAGLAFGLSGYLVARGSFFPMIWAAVWLPWILVGIERLLTAVSWRAIIRAAVTPVIIIAMMLLAGHAQVAWYATLFAGGWAIVRGWRLGGWKSSIRKAGILIGCVVLAVGLTAIQLFPTYEYLAQSQRASAYDFNTAMVYSFSPLRLSGYLIPDLLGNPGYGDFIGYATYWEDAVYIGLIPFVLAITTLAIFRKKSISPHKRLITVLWTMIVIGIVLALGSNSPVFPWLFQHMPTFGLFQAPARWMIWPTAALSVLAGFGADHWSPPGKKARVFLNLAAFGGAVVAGLAGSAALFMPDARSGLVRSLVIFGVSVAVSSFLARRLPAGRLGGWGVAAGVWLVVDLLAANAALNPTIPAKIYNIAYSKIEQINKAAQSGRVWIDPKLDYQIKYQDLFHFNDFQPKRDWSVLRTVLIDEANLLDGIALVNNFDPLLPDRYSKWTAHLENLDPELIRQWLALANTSLQSIKDPVHSGSAVLQPIMPESRLGWNGCAVAAESVGEAMALVETRFKSKNRQNCVVLEDPSITEATFAGSSTVALISERPGSLSLSVDSTSDGWLVVRDTWYPGWIARVDGNPVPIARADYLFRAVKVPAGKHLVEFVYNPDSFTNGFWVSLAFSSLLGTSWFITNRKYKRNGLTH